MGIANAPHLRDIDAMGFAPKLNDVINLQEILALDARLSKTEALDDGHQFVSVLVVSGNNDIAGITRTPMEGRAPKRRRSRTLHYWDSASG